MPHVHERRRHDRTPLVYPVTVRDRIGRIVFRGRSSDVTPCGIRLIGPCGTGIRLGGQVWVELWVPNLRRRGPRNRVVKLQGEVRRTMNIGDWKGVVVVFSSNFSPSLLAPVG